MFRPRTSTGVKVALGVVILAVALIGFATVSYVIQGNPVPNIPFINPA